MKFIEKKNDRLVINIFGLKLKFRRPLTCEDLMKNIPYELADERNPIKVKLPKILNLDESLRAIAEGDHCSLARYGDGEFKLMFGESISFQKYDEKLGKRLVQIIKNNKENLYVGLPDVFGYCKNEYFRRVMINLRDELYKYINFDNVYVDSMITRQSKFSTEQEGNEYYSAIKQLWAGKDIIIVEGEGSRLGIGNDLFSNTNSTKRILCPVKDAFSRYDEILDACLKNASNDSLFILALGPTATVLAYDLCDSGYQALDVGHVDTMYECFLRKADKLVPIEGKIVFNKERNKKHIPPCKDENYYKQIVAKFS